MLTSSSHETKSNNEFVWGRDEISKYKKWAQLPYYKIKYYITTDAVNKIELMINKRYLNHYLTNKLC